MNKIYGGLSQAFILPIEIDPKAAKVALAILMIVAVALIGGLGVGLWKLIGLVIA